jgi:N-acetylneuraminic acid mutarotase
MERSLQPKCTFEPGINYYGNNIYRKAAWVKVETLDECCDACQSNRDCHFFTLLHGKCWLKTRDVGRHIMRVATSGACIREAISSAICKVQVKPTFVNNASASWNSDLLAKLPLPLSEVACLQIDTKLFLVGFPATNVGGTATFIYDLVDDKWTRGKVRPYAGHHHAPIAHAGNVYLFGGLGGRNSGGKVQVYHPVYDMWSLQSDIPYGNVGSVAAAKIGTIVHVCGGLAGSTTAACASYQPASNRWMSTAPMLYAVHHAATGTDGRRMYIFGGRNTRKNRPANGIASLQIYDPTSNAWTMGLPMLFGRSGMGNAPFLFGKFYIMGGEEKRRTFSHPTKVFPQVHTYDPFSNIWEKRPDLDMPVPVHGSFPLVDQRPQFDQSGMIYVIGGSERAGDAPINDVQSLIVSSTQPKYTAANTITTIACAVVRTIVDVATLICPSTSVIDSIQFATKGRSCGGCGNYTTTQSSGPGSCPIDVSAVVSELCVGKNECTIFGTNYTRFGCSTSMLVIQALCKPHVAGAVTPPETPSSKRVVTSGLLDFDWVETGCCRSADGKSGVFEKEINIGSPKECVKMCELKRGCVGIEFSKNIDRGTCEIHFKKITHTDTACAATTCYSGIVSGHATLTSATHSIAETTLARNVSYPVCKATTASVWEEH